MSHLSGAVASWRTPGTHGAGDGAAHPHAHQVRRLAHLLTASSVCVTVILIISVTNEAHWLLSLTHTHVFLETNRKQGGCLIPLFYFTESSSRINISYKQIAFSFLSSISPHALAVHVARLSVVTSQRLYTASIFYKLPEAFIQSRAAWSYGAEDPG